MVQRSPSACAPRSSSPSAASRTACDVDGWRRMPRSSVSGIARRGRLGTSPGSRARERGWAHRTVKAASKVSKGSCCNGVGMGRSFLGAAIRPERHLHDPSRSGLEGLLQDSSSSEGTLEELGAPSRVRPAHSPLRRGRRRVSSKCQSPENPSESFFARKARELTSQPPDPLGLLSRPQRARPPRCPSPGG